MYCSTCGTALATGLSYCNRCGSRTALTTNRLETETPHAEKLADIVHMTSVVTGVVVLGGLIFVYGLVSSLLGRGMNTSAIIVFMIFSMAAVFGISGLLIRQLSRVLDAYLRTGKVETERQIEERAAPQLDIPREPVNSVTEHTTRAFEPVLRDRDN